MQGEEKLVTVIAVLKYGYHSDFLQFSWVFAGCCIGWSQFDLSDWFEDSVGDTASKDADFENFT